MRRMPPQTAMLAVTVAITMAIAATPGRAEIDGHGPDAWRVTGVSPDDRLNARMGPGTNFPVIETFAHNERRMQQVTCVPFYTPAHYERMTQAQIAALPARWCLMRNAELSKAGWVAQRFIAPEDEGDASAEMASSRASGQSKVEPYAPAANIDPVAQAQDLVREVYEREFLSESGNIPGPFDPSVADSYFTSDIVAWLASGNAGAHPLYGAQDFDGAIGEPTPDPDQPMFRGMITINVDFTNFGQQQRAIFYLRADTTKPGAPLRIFRVEHDGWSYP
ncbi:hypothetical protein ACFPLB_09520 [Aquamicrobium segne]|uniref:Uncharacterized protein n=1 Tax=Aquamicrobium segne TaxID=469547 RepID=A0ABW0GZ49_9HYPH